MSAEDRTRVWSARKVAWYQRAIARSDYADRVLGAVRPLLDESRTALDVGAGPGALAIPLARRLERVTAMEPSRTMAAALRATLVRDRIDNVTVIEAAWGEIEVAPHDLVVCARVSPLLRTESAFMAALPTLARRGVVLVRDAPGGDKLFFGELYPILLGRPYERTHTYDETLADLERRGIRANVTEIEYSTDQPFDSLDEACDFWMEYMELEGAETRAWLRDFLAERLTREGPGWVGPCRNRGIVIWWWTAPA